MKTALTLLLVLTGCLEDESSVGALKTKIDTLDKKVAALEAKVDANNATQSDQIINLWTSLIEVRQKEGNSAVFKTSSVGYAAMRTPAGFLLVALRSVEKHANGYNLQFDIGNPNFVTYADAKLNVTYNREFDSKDGQFTEWNERAKSVEVPIKQNILPAKWNHVTVFIAPATEPDLGYISVAIETSKLYLYQ